MESSWLILILFNCLPQRNRWFSCYAMLKGTDNNGKPKSNGFFNVVYAVLKIDPLRLKSIKYKEDLLNLDMV